MKIAHIVGNRPQFIKLALLHDELRKRAAGQSLIIHTGQHYDADMSDVFFGQLHIPRPDHQLQIHSLSHNEMIGNMLIEIDAILALERPDVVVVYGDTNTTLAGALAAKKRGILLAHVEAGVRTGNEAMPEESNRYLTDRMADLNFACTPLGMENLVREGFGYAGAIPSEVHVSGDLMLDAALRFGEQTKGSDVLERLRIGGIEGIGGIGKAASPFILATIHRAENTEDTGRLREIMEALSRLHEGIPVVFPMHPRTRHALDRAGIVPAFDMSPPLGYFDMLALVQASHSVITDSGGLSREAFFFRKPALVIMEYPFWPELFTHGPCLQAAALARDIVAKHAQLSNSAKPFDTGLFGDGRAAALICDILLKRAAEREGAGHD